MNKQRWHTKAIAAFAGTDKPDQAQVSPATVSVHSKRRASAAWHSLHSSLCFRCGQRSLAHSQQERRTRLCSQSCIALQSLHWSFWRKCWQVEAPPHATHLLRTRLCSHIWEPPQALHWSFCRPCWQMDLPPHSLHLRLTPCQAVAQRCARDPQDAADWKSSGLCHVGLNMQRAYLYLRRPCTHI